MASPYEFNVQQSSWPQAAFRDRQFAKLGLLRFLFVMPLRTLDDEGRQNNRDSKWYDQEHQQDCAIMKEGISQCMNLLWELARGLSLAVLMR